MALSWFLCTYVLPKGLCCWCRYEHCQANYSQTQLIPSYVVTTYCQWLFTYKIKWNTFGQWLYHTYRYHINTAYYNYHLWANNLNDVNANSKESSLNKYYYRLSDCGTSAVADIFYIVNGKNILIVWNFVTSPVFYNIYLFCIGYSNHQINLM